MGMSQRRRRYGSKIRISEADLTSAFLQLADLYQWHLRYHTLDSRRNAAGFPDWVIIRPPRVLFVELKSSTGRVSPEQKFFHDQLAQCPGVETYIWRPQDRDEMERVLSDESESKNSLTQYYPLSNNNINSKGGGGFESQESQDAVNRKKLG